MYAIIYMNFNEKKNPVIVKRAGIESDEELQRALDQDSGLSGYEKKAVYYDKKIQLKSLGDGQEWRSMFLQEQRVKIEQALSTAHLISQLEKYSAEKSEEAEQGGPFKKFKARFSQAFNLGRSPKEKAEAAGALIDALKNPEAPSEMKKHHVRALTSGTLGETVKQVPHVYQAIENKTEKLSEKPSNSIQLH